MITLDDGSTIGARSIIVATGAHYKRLPLDRIHDFEGVGVYYAATAVEAQACVAREVAVVGGGNSAGQAALYLAETCATVHLMVRRDGLEETMSRYLIARIERHPKIDFMPRTEVKRLLGDEELTAVEVEGAGGRRLSTPPALPFHRRHTRHRMAPGQARARPGRLRAHRPRCPGEPARRHRPAAARDTVPGVFCVGDARSGSVERVATAMGEGSMAVRLVFDRLVVAAAV